MTGIFVPFTQEICNKRAQKFPENTGLEKVACLMSRALTGLLHYIWSSTVQAHYYQIYQEINTCLFIYQEALLHSS